jgi:hypothetical protein
VNTIKETIERYLFQNNMTQKYLPLPWWEAMKGRPKSKLNAHPHLHAVE